MRRPTARLHLQRRLPNARTAHRRLPNAAAPAGSDNRVCPNCQGTGEINVGIGGA